MIKNFNDIVCDPHVDFVLDVFVGYRIVHFIDTYVIIELNGGYFPFSQFI